MSYSLRFLTGLRLLFPNVVLSVLCCLSDLFRSGKDQLAADKPGGLRNLLLIEGEQTGTTLQAWDTFVQETLHSILDHQMVGSYTNLANLSTVSQVIIDQYAFPP